MTEEERLALTITSLLVIIGKLLPLMDTLPQLEQIALGEHICVANVMLRGEMGHATLH